MNKDTSESHSQAGNREEATSQAMSLIQTELDQLKAEHADLQMLYEAMIEHGEAVEDQLADNNILLQRAQERLEAELSDAANYVMSILPEPREFTPKTSWSLVPSTELGGDSFGYHDIDDDHFAVYLIDVCGHGVGAALLSVTVINVLRAGALPDTDFRAPSEVLFCLNNAFPMERQNNMFFTIWYGIYQRSSGKLTFASGGHPAAIHLREGSSQRTETRFLGTEQGMVIGAIPDMDFESGEFHMQPGDRLLVLSDGTYEVEAPTGEVVSLQDLAKFSSGSNGDLPSDIYAWIRSVNSGNPLPDDYSMIQLTF